SDRDPGDGAGTHRARRNGGGTEMSYKKTALATLLGAAIAVGLAAARAGTDDGHEDGGATNRYSIDCKILMATDNDTIPPTLFGRYPTKGVLTFLAVAEIVNGRLGTTRLDGAKFAMFGRAAGDWKRGKRFEALSLYIDEAPTAEQRRALGTIFRTDELFRAEGMASLSTLKIGIERASTDSLAPVKVTFGHEGGRGSVRFVPMKGGDGTNPVSVQNAFSFFDEKEAIGLATADSRF